MHFARCSFNVKIVFNVDNFENLQVHRTDVNRKQLRKVTPLEAVNDLSFAIHEGNLPSGAIPGG